MKRAFWIILPLALAACDNGSQAPDAALGAATDAAIPVEPDGGIGDGAMPLPDAPAPEGPTIPNILIGAWDYEKGTCDPASDMRIEVDRTELRFYESVGQVLAVRREGDATIVDLAMEGEGERWNETLRLALKNDGTRLHVTEPQAASEVDDYPRRRCPV